MFFIRAMALRTRIPHNTPGHRATVRTRSNPPLLLLMAAHGGHCSAIPGTTRPHAGTCGRVTEVPCTLAGLAAFAWPQTCFLATRGGTS